MKAEQAGKIRIDNRAPLAIERGGGPAVCAGEDDGSGRGFADGEQRGGDCGEDNPASDECIRQNGQTLHY